jgi:Fe-S cluster biogenesis protein NfuA
MMTNTLDAREFQARLQRLDVLLHEVERFADPAAQDHTRELVQAVLDLHGVGLERLLEHLAAAGEAGSAVLDACAGDEVVAGLLLLHGLHPLDAETRVRQALDGIRPFLRSHGGNVELLEVRDGVVRLRLVGNCDGCPSSALTMRQTVEEAILGKAPDVTVVEVEGMAENTSETRNGRALVALPMV